MAVTESSFFLCVTLNLSLLSLNKAWAADIMMKLLESFNFGCNRILLFSMFQGAVFRVYTEEYCTVSLSKWHPSLHSCSCKFHTEWTCSSLAQGTDCVSSGLLIDVSFLFPHCSFVPLVLFSLLSSVRHYLEVFLWLRRGIFNLVLAFLIMSVEICWFSLELCWLWELGHTLVQKRPVPQTQAEDHCLLQNGFWF